MQLENTKNFISFHLPSTKTECALILFVVSELAGIGLVVVGSAQVFESIGSIGSLSFIIGGEVLVLLTAVSLICLALGKCKKGDETQSFSFQLMPPELVDHTIRFAEFRDVMSLMQVNHQYSCFAKLALIQKIKEYGFEGDEFGDAIKYVKRLSQEIKRLIKDKHLEIRGHDFQSVLENLSLLTAEEVLKLYDKLDVDILFFPHFNMFLLTLAKKGLIKPLNKFEPLGNQALVSASYRGNKDIVHLLLLLGADPTQPSQESLPLHFAARSGFDEIVTLLLDHGAQVDDRGLAGNFSTPLCFALGCGSICKSEEEIIKTVQVLLNHGANPNIAANEGSFPLHFAASQGYAKVVGLLLQSGAQVNDRGSYGNTALSFAIGCWALNWNKTKAIQLNIDRTLRRNALYLLNAREHASQQRVQELSSQFMPPQVNKLENDILKTVEILLKHQADSNISDEAGSCPLHHAALQGFDEVVKLLLNNGADVNRQNRKGKKPIDCTSQATTIQILRSHQKGNSAS